MGPAAGVELLGALTARAYAAVGPGLDSCGPDKFDEGNLAFPHQEHNASCEDSTFFKLVSR